MNSIMQIHHPLRQTDSGVPSLEEAAAVVQAQTGYCQQLEAENRYIKVGSNLGPFIFNLIEDWEAEKAARINIYQ